MAGVLTVEGLLLVLCDVCDRLADPCTCDLSRNNDDHSEDDELGEVLTLKLGEWASGLAHSDPGLRDAVVLDSVNVDLVHAEDPTRRLQIEVPTDMSSRCQCQLRNEISFGQLEQELGVLVRKRFSLQVHQVPRFRQPGDITSIMLDPIWSHARFERLNVAPVVCKPRPPSQRLHLVQAIHLKSESTGIQGRESA